MTSTLLGGHVQRADVGKGVIALELRVPGKTWLVVLADFGPPRKLVVGDVRTLKFPARELLGLRRRKDLERTNLVFLSGDRVVLERRADPEEPSETGRFFTVVVRGALLVFAAGDGRGLENHADDAAFLKRSELQAEEALSRLGVGVVDALRNGLRQAFLKGEKRIARRQEAIGNDIEKLEQIQKLATMGPWLLAEAGKVARGATVLEAVDWSTGEAVPLRFPLDPAKGAKEQVEQLFRRAKRSKQGLAIAESRYFAADEQRKALETARAQLDAPPADDDASHIDFLKAVFADAKKAAPRDLKAPENLPGATAPRRTRIPYRTFLARDGGSILVGKGAEGNDALTLHVARPHDLWLHSKGRTGAHVVVPLAKKQECPPERFLDAAQLAAHFSEARGETIVDVQYTERKYLRKPKGSARGFVIVDREKVIALRVAPAQVQFLVDREEEG
jgi:hypothetical protein